MGRAMNSLQALIGKGLEACSKIVGTWRTSSPRLLYIVFPWL